MNKIKIKSSFTNAHHTYDDNALIQKQAALILSDMIPHEFIYPNILEIGVGTGLLTENILNKISFNNYYSTDISFSMLEFSKHKFKDKINYIVMDMDNFAFKTNFDLIVSNFTMQWSENLDLLVKKISSLSNKSAFSIITSNSFNNWKNILYNNGLQPGLINLKSEEDIGQIISSYYNNFHIKKVVLTEEFSSAINFMRHLKLIGASTPNRQYEAANKDFLKFVRSYHKPVILDYEILFCLAEN